MVDKWIESIKERIQMAEKEGVSFGACMLPDPNGGPPMCVKLDEATCKNLGGQYIGGDCLSVKPTPAPVVISKR